jgi:beta-xylosidase
MVEAVMLWNEPNNLSHWDFLLDPEWRIYSTMVRQAGIAVAAENPNLPRVLGGISPIDPKFIGRMDRQGALEHVDVVAVHGFPLDWTLWSLDSWPDRLAEIRAVTDYPVWVTEVGISTFASDAIQVYGLRRTAAQLAERVPRVHWYSLYDLPRAWQAETRHKEREGSSYFRHFHMGLLREDGTPKEAASEFPAFTPELGICQWFHFEDHRLDHAVRWLKKLGVKYVRTGLSWSDSYVPGWEAWFDRLMLALDDFQVTVTYCFTPEPAGLRPHHTSPPKHPEEFADFCARMTRRYAL